ncbi:hypothetical protein GHT06_013195 [Daphnia sinensis]|uniref:carbonyl reductase (NADPH) n=1 Tax=Daphnia sinensis TaxID=1820382 RepID=A0AAD5Q0F9_9CRUS|nr:hypothetical protein GHT06_013195 [Daphnia sinensis]
MSAGKKVAVVTGSNKGIGFAIVKELCQKFDGDVYLTSRDEGRGGAAVEELGKLGFHPQYHQLDIDDEASALRFRDHLQSKYGGLDVLVNNAAIAFKNAAPEPFSQQATETLKTNFFSTLRFCNIMFPILRPHARVVNVSSSAGHLLKISGENSVAIDLRKKLSSSELTTKELTEMIEGFVKAAQTGDHLKFGWPNSAYATSKIGISALTRIQQRAFDNDSRPDIIVNSVHPGYVDTDMTSHKGPLTIEQGAVAPTWLALLPPNVDGPKGGYVWYDKQIVDWVNGPTPTAV